MSEIMEFPNREEFREWLREHCVSNDGIWLLFGKSGGSKTIKAAEALEEALCFGWIDGVMAAVMALDRAIRNEGNSGGSVYDDRGILSF